MIHDKKTIAIGILALAAVAMARTDGITLRKTLHEGVEAYHIHADLKQSISIPGSGDQDFAVTIVSGYSYKIGTVDATAGTAPVELTTKIEKFDADGPMADAIAAQKDKLLVTTTTAGKLDTLDRFIPDPNRKIDPRSLITGSASATLVGPYLEFPDKPVNVGDTWDVTVPKSPITSPEDQKLTATLVGDTTVDGKSAYSISLAGTLKENVDVGKLMKDNPIPDLVALGATDMKITGTIKITGDATVDKQTGQVLAMTLKLATKQETAIAALGDQAIPSTGNSIIKITLDK